MMLIHSWIGFFELKVQYLFKNNKGKDYICGDLHGCFSLLEEKLQSLNFNPESDRLFSVGDIIDRGADSHRGLHYLQQNWFYCIRGNHEQMLVDWCKEAIAEFRQDAFLFHMHNGGFWIADYLGVHIQELADDVLEEAPITDKYPILRHWIEAIEALPYAIEIKSNRKKIGLIHAEIPAHINWSTLEAELNKTSVRYSTLYSRKHIRASKYKNYQVNGVDEVYCGHTIVATPKTVGNVHYIDTGAFSHNNLTIVELDN